MFYVRNKLRFHFFFGSLVEIFMNEPKILWNQMCRQMESGVVQAAQLQIRTLL